MGIFVEVFRFKPIPNDSVSDFLFIKAKNRLKLMEISKSNPQIFLCLCPCNCELHTSSTVQQAASSKSAGLQHVLFVVKVYKTKTWLCLFLYSYKKRIRQSHCCLCCFSRRKILVPTGTWEYVTGMLRTTEMPVHRNCSSTRTDTTPVETWARIVSILTSLLLTYLTQ